MNLSDYLRMYDIAPERDLPEDIREICDTLRCVFVSPENNGSDLITDPYKNHGLG